MDFDKVRVIFVIPDDCEDEKQTSTIMQDAYNSCKQNIIKTMWVREADEESVELQKTDFVVFQEFKGDMYERTLNTRSARILGPWCLLSCLSENKEIPNVDWPLMNLSMESCVVVCSNLQKQRKQELKFKIQAMGGYFTPTLVPQNTHLVTDTVQSEKYNKAAPMGIKIMLPSWVDDVWEVSKSDVVSANAERFSRHACKVFQNLTICATGFENDVEIRTLERLIVQNGGKFSKRMSLRDTDILVCNSSSSEKYKAAKKHKINCLTPQWIHDSVEKGYAIPDMQNYTVKKGTSTPTKTTNQLDPNFSTISAIAGPLSMTVCSVLQETIDSTTAVAAVLESREAQTPKKRKSPHKIAELVDSLEIKKAKIAGPFLDGCSLYLCGFSSEQHEKLAKVLNFSGANRYDLPSERVTHVIVGDPSCPELKILRNKGHGCRFVTVEWIVGSMAEQRPLPEEDYLVKFEGGGSEANGSPLIAKGLRLLRTNTSRVEIADSCSPTTEIQALEDDILQQYLNAPDGEDSMANALAANQFDTRQCITRNPDATSQPSVAEPKGPSSQTSEPSISVTLDESDPAVLRGTTFVLVNFDAAKEEDVRDQVRSLGGTVVPKTCRKIPDYAVVPCNDASTVPTATEVVNETWIEDCYINKAVPDEILYYHRPLGVERSDVLAGAVVTLSGYAQSEKTFLRACCETMGAVVQNVLSRYTSDEKGALKTTHLVSADSSGRKYNAAVKWGLAVVAKEWVLECARRRERLSEKDYLVKGTDDNTMTSSTRLKIDDTPNSKNTVLKTPAAEAKCLTPVNPNVRPNACTTTPLNTTNVCSQITPVNQIMKKAGIKLDENETAQTTPKPWDYVATPDTPYGAFIVDPPPAELKKKFAKWIDGFPEYKPRERRVSTPLSELKRRLWAQIGNSSRDIEVDDVEDASSQDVQHNASIGAAPIATTPKSKRVAGNETPENQIERLEQLEEMLVASAASRRSSIRSVETPNSKERTYEKESQPCSVGWDENMDCGVVENAAVPKKKCSLFMISGVDAEERDNLVRALESMGAQVSELYNSDPASTHLICQKLNRNEKLLVSMASGKWVLHTSYVQASASAGKLLDEEEFEFGNPKLRLSVQLDRDLEQRASCVYYWRKEIAKRGYGAFHDVRAIVVTNKREPLIRVIEAGGGMVIDVNPPFAENVYATHCFLDVKSVGNFKDFVPLAKQGIYCVNSIYVNDFLHRNVNDINDYILPHFQKYY